MISQGQIKQRADWLREAKKRGATHMLVICDTFSYEDYPVYVMPDQNYSEVRQKYQGNMQKLVSSMTVNYDI